MFDICEELYYWKLAEAGIEIQNSNDEIIETSVIH